MMKKDSLILAASSAYNKMYYFNEKFNKLPDQVKDELQVICVLFTEDVGGILFIEFEEDGSLIFKTYVDEADANYDEIGSALKVKEILEKKKDLLKSIELFYKVFFLSKEQ